ncbi:hypothetical protein R0K04_28240, partial [Pseudoalteromonas sp. SIMBA_153]
IETILSLHPSVADVSVIGVRDKQWGERPLALVVLKPDAKDTSADDIKAIAEKAVAFAFSAVNRIAVCLIKTITV